MQLIPHFPPQNLQIPSISSSICRQSPVCRQAKWATKKNKKLFILSIASTSIMTNKYNHETT